MNNKMSYSGKSTFLSRLKTIGLATLNIAAPVAIGFAVEKLVEKAVVLIEIKLHEIYKLTIINSIITFLINLAGILLIIFRPFGINLSRQIAFTFFGTALIISLIRLIFFAKNNGKIILGITRESFSQKSFYKGTENFIISQFPMISKIYTGIELGEKYVPSLSLFPRIENLTRTFVYMFRRQLIIYAVLLSIYTVVFFWIIKPIIIMKYM